MDVLDSLLALEDERLDLEYALEKNSDKRYAEVRRLAHLICSACEAMLAADGDYPSSGIKRLHEDAKRALQLLADVDGLFEEEKPAMSIERVGEGYPCCTMVAILDDIDPVCLEVADDDLGVLGLD